MPFLMCIGFDNPNRLRRNTYYFSYRGVRFKLLQGHPRLSRDTLLSIVASANEADAQQEVYAAAGEFLSALSWKNGSEIAFDYVGRIGWPANAPLRRANFRWTGPPQVPYQGHALGFDIDPIPAITSDHQRRALAMVREALSSNNVLLRFLLYWKVMEIGHARPSEWVNKILKRPPSGFRVPTADIAKLPLADLSLGDYLWEDCRSAIAHIRRSTGRRALRFDNIEEVGRLAFSSNVVAYFARQYRGLPRRSAQREGG